MSAIVEQWDSVSAFLAHVARSGAAVLRHNGRLDNGAWAGDTLPDFLHQCQALDRPGFGARAQEIDRLAETLTGDLPAGISVRRQQIWACQGHSVNVHRVLSGNLPQAWRKTVRRQSLNAGQGRLVLLLPSVVSARVAHAQIAWSAVATLALADYARRSGRSVEIWSIGWHHEVYESGQAKGKHYIWCVPLVRAGEDWDSSAVCLTTYPEWLRRLGFRAMEMTSATYGRLHDGYGHGVATETQLLAWAQQEWAPGQGLHAESILLGCTQFAHVFDGPSARRWAQGQLAALAA
jgi:hypothetical protein